MLVREEININQTNTHTQMSLANSQTKKCWRNKDTRLINQVID